MWLGIQDKAMEGNWKMMHANIPITFTNWKEYEPDGGLKENCATMYVWPGTWQTTQCDGKYPYYCVKDTIRSLPGN